MTTPTTADLVGSADTIYNRTDLVKDSNLQINNTTYQVIDVINHSGTDGFYGAVLRDLATNRVFVVDRGTDKKNWQDFATDVVMAGTDDNLQWQDANALAQSKARSLCNEWYSLGLTELPFRATVPNKRCRFEP